MKILAIETSCDDTGVAVIEIKGQKQPYFNILSNVVSSQVEIHKKWGGVFPSLAKREHQKNIAPTLKEALKKAGLLFSSSSILSSDGHRRGGGMGATSPTKLKILNEILAREKNLYDDIIKFLEKYDKPKVDLIAVTVGPGLEPCLWQGVNFAKALSFYWGLPIIPVNHIEAHILANWLCAYQIGTRLAPIRRAHKLFPAVALVVSGGHTQIILMKNFGKYEILGETRDDAAGECFDKTAKILGIGYPGGPAIAEIALQWKSQAPITNNQTNPNFQTLISKFGVKLPRPMLNTKDYDFSFSGLKTAVLCNFKSQPDYVKKDKNYLIEMSREIQQAIIDVLIKKTIKAAKDYNIKTIILGGGVSANEELRKQFLQKIQKENLNHELYATNYPPYQSSPHSSKASLRRKGMEGNELNLLAPLKNLCADNGAMIGVAGYFSWLKKKIKPWQKIKADANLRIG